MSVSMNGINNSVIPRIYDGPENLSKNNAMHAAYPENSINSNNRPIERLINLSQKNSRVKKHSNNVNMHRRALRMMKRSGLSYNAAMNLVLEDEKLYKEQVVRDDAKKVEAGNFLYWETGDGEIVKIARGGSKGHPSRKGHRTRKHKKTRKH